jgi:hypothetical protein
LEEPADESGHVLGLLDMGPVARPAEHFHLHMLESWGDSRRHQLSGGETVGFTTDYQYG